MGRWEDEMMRKRVNEVMRKRDMPRSQVASSKLQVTYTP